MLRLLPGSARISGSISFEGQDLLALPETEMRSRRGREISMIFQEPMTALNPVMTVGRQIAEAVRAHQPSLASRSVRDRTLEVMEEVGLPDAPTRYGDYPHQFSGGQRQRLLIAMAIVNRPKLLIADEPTTALDVTVQEQILSLLENLRRTHSLAMLFISHDLAVVSRTADRVAVMQHGHIVETAPAQALFRSPTHPYYTPPDRVRADHADAARPAARLPPARPCIYPRTLIPDTLGGCVRGLSEPRCAHSSSPISMATSRLSRQS